MILEIEALVFSGRPNPKWELSKTQEAAWLHDWEMASSMANEVEKPLRLGYTGIIIKKNEHSHWRIFNGCVSFYEQDTVTSRQDPNRNMEIALLKTSDAATQSIFDRLGIV